jgi:hypothetical protein
MEGIETGHMEEIPVWRKFAASRVATIEILLVFWKKPFEFWR